MAGKVAGLDAVGDQPVPAVSAEKSFAGLPWAAKADLAILLAFAALLTGLFWPVWTHNPDLSHGVFMSDLK